MADYYSDPSTRRDRYEALRSNLWTERSTFDAHWRELADFVNPRRARWQNSDRNQGGKTNSKIINSTAKFAQRTLSSGLHAGLTSPARPWMKLTTPDPDLAKNDAVKEWLHDVTNRILVVMAQTNAYNALPVIYGDLGLFGTGAMGILEDGKDLFRCYNYATGTYAVGLDERQLVTTFVRQYSLTVRQLVKQFAVKENGEIDWSVCSVAIKNLWDRGTYEASVNVVHIVTPNEQHDAERLGAKYMKWASCYYEAGARPTDEKKWLRESGYNEFPFMVPRWDVTDGDSYGTDCPGMTALGDVKQLQTMEKRKGQAIAKMVDPALVGPTSLRQAKTSLMPGDVTYVDEPQGGGKLRSIHDVNLRVDHLQMDMERVEYRIQRAFYEDLFLMLARSDSQRGQPPTAREVEERHEEKLLALGPVLERTNDELLDPMVDRIYEMMDRAGLIPEPPDAVKGVKLKVEYISIMAQAQKLVGVVGADRFIQSTVPLADVAPQVLDKIDFNVIVNDYADMLGLNPKAIRSDEEAQGIADQRSQQAQEMHAAEQAKLLAGAAKDAAAAPMNGDNALTRVIGGAGPAVASAA